MAQDAGAPGGAAVARLLSLRTAVPPHALPQAAVKEAASRVLGRRFPDFDRIAGSFDTAGVAMRYSVCPLDWFEAQQDWPSRTAAYLEGATALFVQAAGAALEAAGLAAAQIDTIVTVSSTGIATPGLEARAMAMLDFRADVRRVPVFGLGCAGGVTGLALAARLAVAEPGSRVLFVCVEACTLAFRSDRLEKADVIATVLFGDGAAAACLSTAGDAGIPVGPGQEFTWPDTLPIMGWDVDGDGLKVIFDRSIPVFARKHLAAAVEQSLAGLGLEAGQVARFVCHPGGAKVIDAIEQSLVLEQGSLDHEREVLRDYGNMSAPTALFVLERCLAGGGAGPAGGTLVLVALGPGFTASLLALGA